MSKINRFLLLSSFFAVSFMHATTNVNATTRMAPIRSSINDFVISTNSYNNPEAFHEMACRAHQRAQNEVNKSWLFDEIAFFFEKLWEELTGHFFNHEQSDSNDTTNIVTTDPATEPATLEPLVEATTEELTTTEVFTDYALVDLTLADEFLEEQEIITDEEMLTDEEDIALENLIELEQAMFDYLQETNSMVEEITSSALATAEEESDQSYEDDFDSLIYHLDDETIEIIIQDMIESFFQPYEWEEEINRAETHKEVIEKARKVIFAIRNAARTRHA